jgi:hypothetical protein
MLRLRRGFPRDSIVTRASDPCARLSDISAFYLPNTHAWPEGRCHDEAFRQSRLYTLLDSPRVPAVASGDALAISRSK